MIFDQPCYEVKRAVLERAFTQINTQIQDAAVKTETLKYPRQLDYSAFLGFLASG